MQAFLFSNDSNMTNTEYRYLTITSTFHVDHWRALFQTTGHHLLRSLISLFGILDDLIHPEDYNCDC